MTSPINNISLSDIKDYYNKLIKGGSSISSMLALNKLLAPCIRYDYNNILIKDFTKAITLPNENDTTRLFELEEVPKTVQQLLGHSDISITLDSYTHVLEDIKVIAASKLNDLYIYEG